jgi:16S rRNA (uracil1498-N3)-methyltransferase
MVLSLVMENAEPYIKLPRLYVDTHLEINQKIDLSREQFHYLKNVMRKNTGERIRVFNSDDGEWLAEIENLSKASAGLVLINRLVEPARHGDELILIFTPIKKARLDVLIEKATELGVNKFQPVLTEYTDVRAINLERIQKQIIEACEQCEAINIPTIEPLQDLFTYLDKARKDISVLACIERQAQSACFSDAARKIRGVPAILVGPEGGFSETEKAALRKYENLIFTSLGHRVLRSETAAICAISAYRLSGLSN